eukprot:g14419.t1
MSTPEQQQRSGCEPPLKKMKEDGSKRQAGQRGVPGEAEAASHPLPTAAEMQPGNPPAVRYKAMMQKNTAGLAQTYQELRRELLSEPSTTRAIEERESKFLAKVGLESTAGACPEWQEVFGEDWESIGKEQEQQVAAVLQGFVAAATFGVRIVRDLFVLTPEERALLQKACRSASKKADARYTKVRQQILLAAAPGCLGTPGNPFTNGNESDPEAVDDDNDDDDLFFLSLRNAGAQHGQTSGQGENCLAVAAAVQSGPDQDVFEKSASVAEDSAVRTLSQPLVNSEEGASYTRAAEGEFALMGDYGGLGQSQTQTQAQTQEAVFSRAVQPPQEAQQGGASGAVRRAQPMAGPERKRQNVLADVAEATGSGVEQITQAQDATFQGLEPVIPGSVEAGQSQTQTPTQEVSRCRKW